MSITNPLIDFYWSSLVLNLINNRFKHLSLKLNWWLSNRLGLPEEMRPTRKILNPCLKPGRHRQFFHSLLKRSGGWLGDGMRAHSPTFNLQTFCRSVIIIFVVFTIVILEKKSTSFRTVSHERESWNYVYRLDEGVVGCCRWSGFLGPLGWHEDFGVRLAACPIVGRMSHVSRRWNYSRSDRTCEIIWWTY